MLGRYLIALIMVFTAWQPLFAEDGLRFSIGPEMSTNYGHTSYEMDIAGFDSFGNFTEIRSKLEFPIDGYIAGLRAGLTQRKKNRADWALEASLLTNITDPGGQMKDHDWFTGYPGYMVGIYHDKYFDGKFSYTESSAQMSQTRFSLEVRKLITSGSISSLYVYGGYRHERITQDLIGVDGWGIGIFTDSTFTKHFVRNDTLEVLHYRITSNTAYAGLIYSLDFSRQISCNLSAAYMLAFASDYDDHLLRYRSATADGSGHGFQSALDFRYNFGSAAQSVRPFLDAGCELVTQKISTKQTQEWYGDDPISEEDDTGFVVPGIPHDISAFQFTLGVRLGLEF